LGEEVEGAEAEGAVEAAAQQAERGVFGVAPFFIPRGPLPPPRRLPFSMQAPTTAMNLQRVLRGLQLRRPVLLEGRCEFVCWSVGRRLVSSCVVLCVGVGVGASVVCRYRFVALAVVLVYAACLPVVAPVMTK
jgi:hypothetical protein